MRLKAMQIPAGARVLDIGGGTRTLCDPLSRGRLQCYGDRTFRSHGRVAQEPRLFWCRIGHRHTVPMGDVSLSELGDPFDAVIASYSLSMMDIGEALEKMQVCCRGTVHLFWFLSRLHGPGASRDLWPMIHGGGNIR